MRLGRRDERRDQRLARVRVEHGLGSRRVDEEPDRVVVERTLGARAGDAQIARGTLCRDQVDREVVAVPGHVEEAVAVGVGPRALPVVLAVVADGVDPDRALRRHPVDLLREEAGAIEGPEQERVRVHDDVGVDDVVQVVDGLLELVRRAVVDEPVLGVRCDVVHDLGHELAVARAVAVVVAPGDPVRGIERLAMLPRERRQLGARQRVEPRRRAEGLVEHGDPDAGAALAAGLQRVRADQCHPLRRHVVGR